MTTAVVDGPVREETASGRRRVRVGSWLLPMAPTIVLIGVFIAGPIIWCFWLALTNTALSGAGARDPHFVGLRNFATLFSDAGVGHSLWLTVLFTLGSAVIGQNLVGMALALLMKHRNRIVRAVVGTIVVAAWVLPEIVAGFAIYAFLNSEGTLNALLSGLGIGTQDWLYTAPMFAVILANIWRGSAFSMLIYEAALSEVPADLVEAAQIDGAGPIALFRHVTLPMIRRSAITNLMLSTLQTIGVFGLIYVLTTGGPDDASMTLPLLMIRQSYQYGAVGYGTAIALVLLILGALFSLVYIRSMREEV